MNSRRTVEHLLSLAGITVNGPNPWDIRVTDDRFFDRVLRAGSLALGESYMDGWWDAGQLDQFFTRILSTDLSSHVKRSPHVWLSILRTRLINDQASGKAFVVGRHHYDRGNDLFQATLDPSMTYTCGYWQDVATLEEAQKAKLNLVCRKLLLQPGMCVLDIGCGWGSFAGYAAKRYGVTVVGITVSEEQIRYAAERYAGQPVRFLLQDYRKVTGTFDRIVSLGMFEHVGPKNYRTFMRVARDHLVADGLFLLHTIGANKPTTQDPWVAKYIFPNSAIPTLRQITAATEGMFMMEDIHNFGAYYDRTLLAWHDNFVRHWPELREKYGDRFYRMWHYWLLASAASFRVRSNQLWQIVLSPYGVKSGYQSVR